MSTFWTPANLQRITQGRWLVEPADPDAPIATGITQDTRTLQPGQAYLAIRGEQFDGHTFIDQAFAAGATLAVVDQQYTLPGREEPSRQAILQVADPVEALQWLASAYRDRLAEHDCKVIAVCGSNGKTTTRHLLHHVLTTCGLTGTQSPKSFNNHLGVPLTLLAADPSHDFVAAEIGTNHPGEIAALGQIARPDAAIITSIGHEHMEFFHTLDGVAKEEASIMKHVRPDGFIAMPAAAAELTAPYYDVQEGVFLQPIKDASGVPDDLPLPGEHSRMNAAIVMAVGRWLELDPTAMQSALRTASGPPGRLQRIALGQGVNVIHDAYNANPDSMRASLSILANEPGRRVAILGSMFELGDASPQAHAEIAALANRSADHVVLIGEAFNGHPWSESLPAQIADGLAAGDTILLKASRGMRLERLIPAIEARFPRPT